MDHNADDIFFTRIEEDLLKALDAEDCVFKQDKTPINIPSEGGLVSCFPSYSASWKSIGFPPGLVAPSTDIRITAKTVWCPSSVSTDTEPSVPWQTHLLLQHASMRSQCCRLGPQHMPESYSTPSIDAARAKFKFTTAPLQATVPQPHLAFQCCAYPHPHPCHTCHRQDSGITPTTQIPVGNKPISDGRWLLKMLIDEATADIIAGATGGTPAQNPWETPCELQLLPQHQHFPGTLDRILLIRGDREGIEKYIGQLYEKVMIKRPSCTIQLKLKLAVPNSSVSMLIGKQGLAVKAIKKLTGCRVSISKRVGNIEQRILTISGKPGKPMMLALLRICEKLQMNRDLASQFYFTPCVQLPLGVWGSDDRSRLDHMNQIVAPGLSQQCQAHEQKRDHEHLRRVKQHDANDTIKTKSKKELLDAVAEAWHSQGGKGPALTKQFHSAFTLEANLASSC